MKHAGFGLIARHCGLAAVIGLYVALAAGYAWRVPILEGADEHGHASYIDFVVAHHVLPEIGTVWESVQPPLYYVFAAGAVAISGGPLLVPETLRANPAFSWDRPGVADTFDPRSYTVADARPARRMRLLSMLFGAVTLLLIYATALQATRGRRRVALAAAALPALTPQFAHHHAVITNDALATLWCALLTWQLLRALSSGPRAAAASPVAMGVVAGLGMLTKYTVVPVAAAAFAALALWPGDARGRARRTAAFTAAALAVCGGWLAWNTLHYGDPLAHAAMRRAHAVLAVDRSMLDLTLDRRFLNGVFESYWGRLGSLTVPLHVDAYAALTLFTVVGVLGIPLAYKVGTVLRDSVAALVAIIVLTWLAFLAHNTSLSAAQGRLLFPALPAISVLLVAGWAAGLDAAVAFAKRHAVVRAGRPILRVLPVLPVAALVVGLVAINLQTLAGPVQTGFHDAPAARDRLAQSSSTAARPLAHVDIAALTAGDRPVAASAGPMPSRPVLQPNARTTHSPNGLPPAVSHIPAVPAPADPPGALAAAAADGDPRRDRDRSTASKRKPTPLGVVASDGETFLDGADAARRRVEPNGEKPAPAPEATSVAPQDGAGPAAGPAGPST